MKPSRLKRFEHLYVHSRYMGAASILRRFLGLPSDFPIPLSLSHGVDCGQYRNALDVEAIEPLHWSHNADIHEAASKVKRSVKAPHPWAIIAHGQKPTAGRGVLLIGPPPSPANDENLYQLIKHEDLTEWTVLVKARGEYEASLRFWRERGLRAITARGADDTFYERLHPILAEYESVVGCSFSSALLFASAIGKKVVLLRDYAWEIYEASNFRSEIWLESPCARRIVRVFADGTQQEKIDASRVLLGFDMLDRPQAVRRELEAAIDALERPFHRHADNPIPYKLGELLTIASKKQGFVKYSKRDLLTLIKRQQVCILRMNDIDAWLNGPNDGNCRLVPVAFQKGITQPGWAPAGYEPHATAADRAS